MKKGMILLILIITLLLITNLPADESKYASPKYSDFYSQTFSRNIIAGTGRLVSPNTLYINSFNIVYNELETRVFEKLSFRGSFIPGFYGGLKLKYQFLDIRNLALALSVGAMRKEFMTFSGGQKKEWLTMYPAATYMTYGSVDSYINLSVGIRPRTQYIKRTNEMTGETHTERKGADEPVFYSLGFSHRLAKHFLAQVEFHHSRIFYYYDDIEHRDFILFGLNYFSTKFEIFLGTWIHLGEQEKRSRFNILPFIKVGYKYLLRE
jgi:hypothetical protein